MENILTAISNDNFLKLDPFEAVTYSTDLLSFFLPSVLHPVFGDAYAGYLQQFLRKYQ